MDLLAFRGTALNVHLPIGEELLNKGADTFVKHPELDRLELICLEGNRLLIKFTISPKIVINRELQVFVHQDLGFPENPRLHLTIEHGFRMIDRMVIGFIKNRLPDWIQLQSGELYVDLEPVFAMSDMQEYISRVEMATIEVEAGRLIINAAFKN